MNTARILVVEDNADLRAAVAAILEQERYTVLSANDGVQALELMEHSQPDLIVADIMMPRMDGHQLYQAIRAHTEWTRIPFIFLTARAQREDLLKGKRVGAEDYITKPFDPVDLLVAIQARLERARAVWQASEAEFEQLKREIALAISHELRTPLTHVVGYLELAQADVMTADRDTLSSYLVGARHGARRLTRLVEDLSTLMELESGGAHQGFATTAQVRYDLGRIVQTAVGHFETQAAERGLAVLVSAEAKIAPVRIHEALFVNALGRLVDNAIKFSSGRSRKIEVTAGSAGSWVVVSVRDQGIGIAPEKLSLLFEHFRQIDRAKLEQQGTGLGLSIAQGIIHLHGGELAVESEVGAGSTFSMRLPVSGD